MFTILYAVRVFVCTERKSERARQTDRQTEREKEREIGRERDREGERERDRESDRERRRQKERGNRFPPVMLAIGKFCYLSFLSSLSKDVNIQKLF